MGLVKRTYVDGETVITAENLNAIQDAIIENEEAIEDQGEAIGGKYTKPSGGIPASDMASAVQTSLEKADSALQSSDIDSTLTVTGKAADAKKTGDEISDVRNTLNQFTRPNLLDNWYFVYGKAINNDYSSNGTFPLNQRGAQSYLNSGYAFDRWKLEIGSGVYLKAEIQQSGIILTNYSASSDNAWVSQYTEQNYGDGSTPYTISVLCGAKTGNCTVYFGGSNQGIQLEANSLTTLTYNTVSGNVGMRFVIGVDSSVEIKAVKLELGFGQTLAHWDGTKWVLNEIPNYDEQLYRCCTSTADSSDTYANRTVCYSRNLQNTITLNANQYVSPFTHYGTWNVYSSLKPGEKVISASAIDSVDGIPMVCGINSERNFISVIGTKTSAIVLATVAKT